ncbi:MAG: carboxylating nicotinate-nucleotide diphosphorylase [Chloroflexi bacterium]|jgi:nicotinate-nucleotide pyrophosphorylase (carboxylating)|nr:carboxylating nicotinate-nucleotide diphosphorylase [Chloroflexota bacterium]
MKPSVSRIKSIVVKALEEDLGQGDITTEALISPSVIGKASLLMKSRGVLAGIQVAEMTFEQVDSSIRFERLVQDGMKVEPGDRVASITGKAASILKAERVALNFLQRLSGVATETAKYVEAVSDTKAKILDTRKTTPGLRIFEKYAVKVGGGHNHRQNLGEQVLIKDNHLMVMWASGMGVSDAVRKARENTPLTVTIEIEVETPKEAQEAVAAGADIILLDNMGLMDMRRAVKAAKGTTLTEASGGITLDNVGAVAKTGVDYISVGALTHSVKALDISLEIELS